VLLVVSVVLGGDGALRMKGVMLAMIGAGRCAPIIASGACHLIAPPVNQMNDNDVINFIHQTVLITS